MNRPRIDAAVSKATNGSGAQHYPSHISPINPSIFLGSSSLPASPMSYGDFLLTNATRISSIESTLRSLTWFLPGRFKDAELASEALYAALNLLSLYHDGIITKAASRLPPSSKPALSTHARYTTAWSRVSSSYRLISRALAIISHSELLIEMCARRILGSKRRWRVVLMVECFKALLRLKLVELTGRMLVNPPLPERTVDPSTLQPPLDIGSDAVVAENGEVTQFHCAATGQIEKRKDLNPQNHLTWVGRRTGITRPSIASLRSQASRDTPSSDIRPTEGTKALINRYLAQRALTLEEVLRPLELVRRLPSSKAKLAELVWILRPVLYVLAISRYGPHHPASFLSSLSIEYSSYSMRKTTLRPQPYGLARSNESFHDFVTELERNELNLRAKQFWSYLLRGPVWMLFTKPKLKSIGDKLSGIPLLNIISMAIDDYTPLIDEYYYYTS